MSFRSVLGLRGVVVIGGLAFGVYGSACMVRNTIRVVRTAEGRKLELEEKPSNCDLLISRSVIHGQEQVLARLSYTGNRVGRDDVEKALRVKACKLGADTLLIERESYDSSSTPGTSVEVLALALVRADSATTESGDAHEPKPDAEEAGTATGTCFAVDADGSIMTAEHVIHDAKNVQVQFEGEEPIAAAVLERRPTVDVAVLKIQRKTNDFLPLKESRASTVGDRVFTFGFPVIELLGKEPKFTDGAISALAGYAGARNLMQVTIPIQPGNSGGPVVTETGFAIGVVVSTAAALPFLKATGSLPQGLNWAVKSELAMAAVEPPDQEPTATDRAGAVARARRAVCAVTAER